MAGTPEKTSEILATLQKVITDVDERERARKQFGLRSPGKRRRPTKLDDSPTKPTGKRSRNNSPRDVTINPDQSDDQRDENITPLPVFALDPREQEKMHDTLLELEGPIARESLGVGPDLESSNPVLSETSPGFVRKLPATLTSS